MGTRRQNDVAMTSMRRHDVGSTSGRYFEVVSLLGHVRQISHSDFKGRFL